MSFHKARHSFGQIHYDKTKNLFLTQKELGHKSIATTQIYAAVNDEERRKAVKKLPSFLRK
jgi:integrase